MALLYSDPIFLTHETGSHPESASRLKSVTQKIDQSGILQSWTQKPAVAAKPEFLERVHGCGYIKSVQAYAERGGGRIESDTVVCPASHRVAVNAAGTAVDAVDEVLNGHHEQAVCLIRPPGHHALPEKAMGFCLYNNVAVAARHAVQAHGLNRVLIIDWDVHHGNGTQDIFYESPNVFFMSVHRSPFYPGTGASNETGTGSGLGTTFNLPLAMGCSRKSYHEQFQSLLNDVVTRCQPELVLISAGFDAHIADPIGSLGLESEDFTVLTELALDVASQNCQGRVVSLLEGGYNVDALAESVACHLQSMTNQ